MRIIFLNKFEILQAPLCWELVFKSPRKCLQHDFPSPAGIFDVTCWRFANRKILEEQMLFLCFPKMLKKTHPTSKIELRCLTGCNTSKDGHNLSIFGISSLEEWGVTPPTGSIPPTKNHDK